MSWLSAFVSFAIKEAPHFAEDLKAADNLLKQVRDIVNKYPHAATLREGAAALTALETAGQQTTQLILAHSSMVAAPGKSATPAKKS